MDSEAVEKKYILNDNITVVVKTVRDKGRFKNKLTTIFEKTDDQPLDFGSKKAIATFLQNLDYKDNQTDIFEEGEDE